METRTSLHARVCNYVNRCMCVFIQLWVCTHVRFLCMKVMHVSIYYIPHMSEVHEIQVCPFLSPEREISWACRRDDLFILDF